MKEKLKIGLWTSAWDRVAWMLIEAVISNVISKFIPDSTISYVLFSEDRRENFGEDLMRNVRNEGIVLHHFRTVDFQPDQKEKAVSLFKETGDRSLLIEWRIARDRAIREQFPDLNADLNVLLGYMGIVGPEMCSELEPDMINLHPALPWGPKGTSWDVIRENIETRATETGVMMHLVNKELDRGPVISYCRFPILGENYLKLWELWKKIENPIEAIRHFTDEQCNANLLCSLTRRDGVVREIPLIHLTLKSLAEGSIVIQDGKIFDSTGNELVGGRDLTTKVNNELSNRNFPGCGEAIGKQT